MPVLSVTIENSEELLNASYLGAGALGRVERSATGGGSGYSEISTFAIVSGTRIYTVYDLSGAITSWYRVRYSKSDGTSTSSYGEEFQVGPEQGGFICSLYDVKQRLGISATDTADDEQLTEFIRQATADICNYTGRRFVRSPSAGSTTFLFDVIWTTREFRISGGIASATTLEVATQSQPESSGTYTTVPSADWMLRPVTADRDYGWPATSIILTDRPTGTVAWFWPGLNAVRLTGALGWDTVPADIDGIGQNVVIRRFQAKGSGVAMALGADQFGGRVMRFISPEEREQLDRYRVPLVG